MDDLHALMLAIADGDDQRVHALLRDAPELATAAIADDAARSHPAPAALQQLACYFYRGDTALHVAAAAHRPELVVLLIDLGAPVGARNRRGATPLHFAAAGSPASARWNPEAQVATIAALLAAGADPEAEALGGVTPLHRAVRSRCSAAVAALLAAGASAFRPNANGSSPLLLASRPTGRGGSGTPAARREQAAIIHLLEQSGASL